MSYALPFARGWYQPSNADGGAVPSALLGKLYVDPSTGDLIQIVKNTDGSVVAGNQAMKWEAAANYEVDYATDSGDVKVAGISDPAYANRGVTVPINAAFWVVKRGPVQCISEGTMAIGGNIIASPTDGQVQNGVAGDDPAAVIGVSYESGNAGDSVLCMVNIP